MIAAIIGASLAIILTVCQRIWVLERRVITLNDKLDALLKHSKINFDPSEGISEKVMDALARGDKIEAIKLYRTATGTSLKAAKAHIDNIQTQDGV